MGQDEQAICVSRKSLRLPLKNFHDIRSKVGFVDNSIKANAWIKKSYQQMQLKYETMNSKNNNKQNTLNGAIKIVGDEVQLR